jgi:shikimate kinase
MGSGKTSIGRSLASKLNRDFFDSDFEIASKAGVDINHIFDVEGEEGFRNRETQKLKKLCKMSNIVIATGGGIVLRKENRELLSDSFVIYLSSNIKELVKRVASSKTRPLLQRSTDKEKTITDLLKKREHLYKKTADLIIENNENNYHITVNKIIQSISK